MGGRATVMVIGPVGLADVALQRIHRLEALWSRFIETSDTSRINQRAGTPTTVSPEMITLCTHARQAWLLTDGRYDPLLGRPLAALGYDRSFDSIGEACDVEFAPRPRGPSPGIQVDAGRSSVTVPEGHCFDPGGIGKGLAGDLVVRETLQAGASGVLVDLGGDIRVAGDGPEERGWPIAIEDPRHDGDLLAHVLLADGAVASSSRRRRAWNSGGEERHHLLDPSDGRPVHNGVLGVTVLAGTGWEAEALTKAAFVTGAEGVGLIEEHRADGVIVLDDGTCRWTPGLVMARA